MFMYSLDKLINHISTSVYYISIKYGLGMNDIEYYGLKKYFISYVEREVKLKIDLVEDESKLKIYKEAENYIEKEMIEEDNESKIKEFKGEEDFIIIEKEKTWKNIDIFEKEKNEKTEECKNEKTEECKNEKNEEEKEKEKKILEVMDLAENFFEKILIYIGPIQVLIKAKELSIEIFDLCESLKNRKENDWNLVKIERL